MPRRGGGTKCQGAEVCVDGEVVGELAKRVQVLVNRTRRSRGPRSGEEMVGRGAGRSGEERRGEERRGEERRGGERRAEESRGEQRRGDALLCTIARHLEAEGSAGSWLRLEWSRVALSPPSTRPPHGLLARRHAYGILKFARYECGRITEGSPKGRPRVTEGSP